IRYAYGSAFIDVDKDSQEELFMVDTEGKNKLYKIDAEFFEKIQAHKFPTDIAGKFNIDGQIIDKNGRPIFDHSVSFGDIDNDGDEDAYITSLYKNNLFYENRNGKFFKEKAEQAGIDIGITR
ncbi:MAG: hypothetical protein GXO74_10485, partial [Calditrichaeota bacterium]|nr:hypothetical protein [Calditrichota bacterium]